LDIIGKKTAELFGSCAEVGALNAMHQAGAAHGSALRNAPAVRALREYGRRFGLAFQIRDDLYDATADEAELGKPAGSDLREKKMTLPVIFALESGAQARSAISELYALDDPAAQAARPLFERVIALLRADNVVARTRAAIAEHARAAEAALADVPLSPARDELAVLARKL